GAPHLTPGLAGVLADQILLGVQPGWTVQNQAALALRQFLNAAERNATVRFGDRRGVAMREHLGHEPARILRGHVLCNGHRNRERQTRHVHRLPPGYFTGSLSTDFPRFEPKYSVISRSWSRRLRF